MVASVQDEAAIVRRAQQYLKEATAGEQPDPDDAGHAWDEFYRTYDPLIRKYVGTVVKRADIDDYVQEIWLQLIQSLRQLAYEPQRGRFSSWLHQLVQNKVFSLLRQERRRPAVPLGSALERTLPAADADPTRPLEQQLERQNVAELIDALRGLVPPLSFQVFHMRVIEGRSVFQVAWALNLSQQQVWFRQHRVRKHLSRLIEQQADYRGRRADSLDRSCPTTNTRKKAS